MYVETTIVSYLSARKSADVIVVGHQQATRKWWRLRRPEFQLYCSQFVLDEAAQGDTDAARRRLRLLRQLPVLAASLAVQMLARKLIRSGGIPREAGIDALHIAVATVHGIDYLLTWNQRHIANAQKRNNLAAACAAEGFELPVICTPEELMEIDHVEGSDCRRSAPRPQEARRAVRSRPGRSLC